MFSKFLLLPEIRTFVIDPPCSKNFLTLSFSEIQIPEISIQLRLSFVIRAFNPKDSQSRTNSLTKEGFVSEIFISISVWTW